MTKRHKSLQYRLIWQFGHVFYPVGIILDVPLLVK